MLPSLLDFLNHIYAECCFVLENTENKTKEEFLKDEVLIRAAVRSLEVIGEATKKLPIDFRTKHPHINWNEMAGMRDILIHNYFGIDYDVVWNTIQNDISQLQTHLHLILYSQE